MKKELIKLANHLDRIGYVKEADYIDTLLKKEASLCAAFLLGLFGCDDKKGSSYTGPIGSGTSSANLPEISWEVAGKQIKLTHMHYVSFEECIYNPFIPQIDGDMSWMRSSEGAVLHIKATWDLSKMEQDGVIDAHSKYKTASSDTAKIEDGWDGSLYFVARADWEGHCGGNGTELCFSSNSVYEDEALALAGSNHGGYYKDGHKLMMECYGGSSAWHSQDIEDLAEEMD